MTRQMSAYIFWCAVALIFYVYVGYPAWIFLRSRLHPRPHRREPMLPSVSIIVAVHNGVTLLRQRIDNLLALDYPRDRMEVIFVSDGSTDGTNEILQGTSGPPITSICCAEHCGKAAALNLGMRRATGDILVFVDIRPWLDLGAVKQMVSNFADPSVGCVAGELILHDGRQDAATKAVGGLYWRYEQWIRICEAKVDSPCGVYGGFYAVRRHLAEMLPDGTILDDMLQPLYVIRQGYRSVIDPQARVYDAWPESLSGEFQRKVRTLAGNFQLLTLAPWVLSRKHRLRFQLISHKLMRLIVPILLLTTLVTSAVLVTSSRFYAAAFVIQIIFYALAAIDHALPMPTMKRIGAPARAFCMLNAAVVVGFYHFLFAPSPLWKIWTASTAMSAATRDHRHA